MLMAALAASEDAAKADDIPQVRELLAAGGGDVSVYPWAGRLVHDDGDLAAAFDACQRDALDRPTARSARLSLAISRGQERRPEGARAQATAMLEEEHGDRHVSDTLSWVEPLH